MDIQRTRTASETGTGRQFDTMQRHLITAVADKTQRLVSHCRKLKGPLEKLPPVYYQGEGRCYSVLFFVFLSIVLKNKSACRILSYRCEDKLNFIQHLVKINIGWWPCRSFGCFSSIEQYACIAFIDRTLQVLCLSNNSIKASLSQTQRREKVPSLEHTISADMGWQARSAHIQTYIATVWDTEKVSSTDTGCSRCDVTCVRC